MERNYGTEIDELRRDITEIKMLLSDLKATNSETAEPKAKEIGHVKVVENVHPDKNVMKLMEDCERKCGEENLSGCMTYLGVFAAGERQSNWAVKDQNIDELLDIVDNSDAEKILLIIGSTGRLKILRALLKKPMTVAEMTEELNFGTTGQTYHYLKLLIYEGIVTEVQKGRYSVVPHKYQGIMLILAGINDLIGGYEYKHEKKNIFNV